MREIQFPTNIADAKVKAAVAEYARLVAEGVAADNALREVEARRPDVEEEQRRAFASAIRAGQTKEPSSDALAKLDVECAAARRRTEALAVAVTEAFSELVTVVEQRRDAWGAEIARQVEKDQAALARAVEGLVAARDRLSDTLASALWLHNFPTRTTLMTPMATSRVPGVLGPNHEPILWSDLADALRRFGQEPKGTQPVLAGTTS